MFLLFKSRYTFLEQEEKGMLVDSLLKRKHQVKTEIELKINALRTNYVKFEASNNILHSGSLEELQQKCAVKRT